MEKLSRRNFLKYAGQLLTITGLAAVFAPVVAFFFPAKLEEMPSDPVMVGPKDDLAVGESRMVSFGRYPAIVLNTPEGLRAYSAVCTHFACIVKWDPDLGQMVCPCHEAYFHPSDGHVISGPPPSPLLSLDVYVENGDIFVSGGAL
jgi:cytochrome b6-f complex iron-sulfur subunit